MKLFNSKVKINPSIPIEDTLLILMKYAAVLENNFDEAKVIISQEEDVDENVVGRKNQNTR